MSGRLSGKPAVTLGATGNLAVATVVSMVNFWAWNIVGPMSTRYSDAMGLSSTEAAVLVAMPVLVGSLGRIPVGALTDRFGGRTMFAAVTVLSIVPVLIVGLFASLNQFALLLVSAFALGVAGTVFAVGIPFVSAWYPPARRGFATGVFGMGMAGTALSAFLTPRFVTWWGGVTAHLIIAAVLVLTLVAILFLMSEAPGWRPHPEPFLPKLMAAAKLPVTWNMGVLYALLFGGFVAFATYLPTYLKNVYAFSAIDAGARTAGFALAAVAARPIGGALSDRIAPKIVVLVSLAGTAVMAVVVAVQPPPELLAGLSFCGLAVFLGIGTGGVFAWLSRLAPPDRVGSVTGLVSAAGGLGGYFPPLVMGATYNAAANNYDTGLVLLCLTAVIALTYTAFLVPSTDPTRHVSTRVSRLRNRT